MRLKALHIVKQINFDMKLKASAKWCYLFMKRHDISIRRRTSIAQKLPSDAEDKLIEYQRYIILLREQQQYPIGNIANADQTPLTFDLPLSETLTVKGEKSITLKSTGSEK